MNDKSTASQASGATSESARTMRAPVTDRVNFEPAILHGMTVREAYWIAVLSFVVMLLLAGLVFLVTRHWQVVLLMPLMGTCACLWIGSQYLQSIKRGRPDAYYTQALHMWMADRGLRQDIFVRHDGYWSLGRTLDLALSSPLDPGADGAAAGGQRAPVRTPDRAHHKGWR
jgi:conjugative transfer region protein (TIGR03750 family)